MRQLSANEQLLNNKQEKEMGRDGWEAKGVLRELPLVLQNCLGGGSCWMLLFTPPSTSIDRAWELHSGALPCLQDGCSQFPAALPRAFCL